MYCLLACLVFSFSLSSLNIAFHFYFYVPFSSSSFTSLLRPVCLSSFSSFPSFSFVFLFHFLFVQLPLFLSSFLFLPSSLSEPLFFLSSASLILPDTSHLFSWLDSLFLHFIFLLSSLAELYISFYFFFLFSLSSEGYAPHSLYPSVSHLFYLSIQLTD